MSIEEALAIDGWMSPEELAWLAEQAAKRRCIVEIGSYLGRSTKALAATPGTVYAIDDWYGPRDVDWLTPEQRATVYERFQANASENVVPVNSDHAVARISEKPDMVFIDGDHEFANVLRDIERWRMELVPGGLLCGHDAYREGVAQAVRLVFNRVQIAAETTIWYEFL